MTKRIANSRGPGVARVLRTTPEVLVLVALLAAHVCLGAEYPPAEGKEESAFTNSTALPPTNNLLPSDHSDEFQRVQHWQSKLELARELRRNKAPGAEKELKEIVESDAPAEFRRIAWLELAYRAQDARELAKAQHLFAEYVTRYAEHPSVPEVFLRQGLLYRDMSAPSLAISKFYSVMSSALHLKLDRVEYYQRLVLQAQTEIADTYYLQGNFKDAADYFSRLLKLESADLNKSLILYKLVRSLAAANRNEEVIAQGQYFTGHYTNNTEMAEVRFLLADAFKKLGRSRDALLEVNALLQSQHDAARQNPDNWIYWQQRAGNEIANQLYKEGDYVNALIVYRALSALDNSASWQIPIWYQMGLIYEKLKQPAKAADIYGQMLTREKDFSTNAPSPALTATFDMARWRTNHLRWMTQAEVANQQFSIPPHASVDGSR